MTYFEWSFFLSADMNLASSPH